MRIPAAVNYRRQSIQISNRVHREPDQVQPPLSGEHRMSVSIFPENSNRLHSPSSFDRKISAHEFERGGLLKPIVNTIDGTPTFLSVYSHNDSASGSTTSPIISTSSHHQRPQRLSRNELKHLDEKQLIFELVRRRRMNAKLLLFPTL